MLIPRIIPCLLLKDDHLVKTSQFKSSKYVGDPLNAVRIFNEKEVDELILLDISASTKKKEPHYELIGEIASECFMPLCYGGGITNINQAKKIFSLGVEKICLQTAALENLEFVRELADSFGSQSIVVSIDVSKNWLGHKKLYAAVSQKNLQKDWKIFYKQAVDAGAGEIFLNATYCDGMMQGMDFELISEAAKLTNVPLIASGGAGTLNDLKLAIQAGANAVGVGAMFVFQGTHRAVLISYPNREQLENFLG